MQRFCEDVVEPLFKSKLPEQYSLRSKLCPSSPFSDEPPSPAPSIDKTLPGSRAYPSSTTVAGQQSAATTNAPARNRSLSASLAQEKEKERCSKRGRNTGQSTPKGAHPANQHVACMEGERSAGIRVHAPLREVRVYTPLGDLRAPHTARSSSCTPLNSDDDDLPSASVPILNSPDILGDRRDSDEDSDEEIWLPKSSPEVLLLDKSGWTAGIKKP
ncbi:hypothetical protein DFH29DRAFT_1083974 [Suillus ampliporus]|nr:hypothetical protein DFH29DRAFT_1083974 [Suillus ampliporus]